MDAFDLWVWWAIIAVCLAIAEVLTTALVFAMFAGGAAMAALAAYLGAEAFVQALVFVAVSAVLLVTVRPIARRHRRMPPTTRTGVNALIGQSALVTERVDPHDGRIKLAGEIWSARSLYDDRAYEPGTTVDVVEIKGAAAVVIGPENS